MPRAKTKNVVVQPKRKYTKRAKPKAQTGLPQDFLKEVAAQIDAHFARLHATPDAARDDGGTLIPHKPLVVTSTLQKQADVIGQHRVALADLNRVILRLTEILGRIYGMSQESDGDEPKRSLDCTHDVLFHVPLDVQEAAAEMQRLLDRLEESLGLK